MSGFSTSFGRRVDGYHYVNSLESIDRFEDKGFMLSGTLGDLFTGNKIQVLKTDWDGSFGSCTREAPGIRSDTTQFININAFSWINNSAGAVSAIPMDAGASAIDFKEQTVCEKMDCIPANAVTDDGCYATTLTEYWNKYEFIALEALKVSDGYIMCGYNRKTYQPLVTKVSFSGAVMWSKTLNTNHHDLWLSHIRLMDDGNILLSGEGGYTINHEGYTITGYIKVTPSGSIMWSKYMRGMPADLKTNGDGTVTLLHYPDGASHGQMAITKLDADGHLLERRRLNKSGEIIPTHERMIIEGNYMYAVGEAYNSIALEKFQLDGKRVWSKRFSPENKNARVEGVYLIGDSVYFTARVLTPVGWGGKENLVLVKVSKDGNGLNSVVIEQDLIVYSPQFYLGINAHRFHTTMTSDGNFVLADVIPGSSGSSIALIKFSPAGKILWAKNYPGLNSHLISSIQSDESGLTILGLHISKNPTNGYPFYNPILIHTNNEGDVVPGTGSTCNAVSFTASAIPINLVDRFLYAPGTPNFEYLEWTEQSYQTFERPLETIAKYSCGIKADCSSVQLSGPSSMCLSAEAFVYEAKRNLGCDVPITWKYDTAYVQMFASTELSSSFVFKRAGKTKIYASMPTTCKVYIDSIEVTIRPSAKILDLGSDTTICPGNIIILNAKKGYESYVWQDGSIDSTFTVTKPGTYRVTVTDACNESYSDETIVVAQPPIVFDLGPDRNKCDNDTLQLNAPAGFISYSWTPSYNITTVTSHKVIVKPSKDTFYAVVAEKTPGCFVYDTVRVTVNTAPPIQLGTDLSFCNGDSSVLDASSGFASYLWSTGENTQRISVRTVGQYRVTATTDKGCKATDTLFVKNVWPLPIVTLDKNSELCQGSSRNLNAGNYSSYLWNDGSTSKSYTAKGVGRHYVQVNDVHGCVGSDTMEIKTILPLPANFLSQDTAICSYSEAQLKPRQNYSSYTWSDGSRSSSIIVDKPGIYWLQVEDGKHCVGRDSIIVSLKDCMNGVYVPTAFTPNRDGKNDLFKALVFGVVQKYELTVYNRWGQVVFKTSDAKKGWDGRVNGLEVESDVYIWTCVYHLQGGEAKAEKGTVTLIH